MKKIIIYTGVVIIIVVISVAGHASMLTWQDISNLIDFQHMPSLLFDGSDTGDFISGGNMAPMPEPRTLLLIGSGLTGVALYRRRKHK